MSNEYRCATNACVKIFHKKRQREMQIKIKFVYLHSILRKPLWSDARVVEEARLESV